MTTIEENRKHWSDFDWDQHEGDWSEVWGTSDAMWHASLWPHISTFVGPAASILEIAPGYGRFTTYLKDHCDRLVG